MVNEWKDVKDWNYIETKKEFLELIKSIPNDSELMKDVRVLKHVPTNKHIT